MIEGIVFRCDATWREAFRIWWAVCWRALVALFLAGEIFTFVVCPTLWSWRPYPNGGFTLLYAGFITICTYCLPFIALSTMIGWKIGAARLVLVQLDPKTLRSTKPHRTKVNGDEALRIWLRILWQCAIPQALLEYAAWYYAMRTSMTYAVFYLAALATYICWIPAIKSVVGMKLGIWRLAIEPEIIPQDEREKQRTQNIIGVGGPGGQAN